MPKAPAQTEEEVLVAAMRIFWQRGYGGLSIDEIVRGTGASRHALYGAAGGKRALYLEAFRLYQEQVVTPAFGQVEAPNAGLNEIRSYFLAQIDAAEAEGLPGPGCLVANASTETAPHDPGVSDLVQAHNDRLTSGFRGALINAFPGLPSARVDRLADYLAVSAQGLWSYSRTTGDAALLRAHVDTILHLINAYGAANGK